MRVLIGYDSRNPEASEVAAKSLKRVTNGEIEPEFLCLPKLRDQGLITRTFDYRDGQGYDLASNETFSTEFKFSRFLAPILCQQGYVLCVDNDVVFLRDPREMLDEVVEDHAISVVWHDEVVYPTGPKLVNQVQTQYRVKCASSVCLWNVDHPANRRLSLRDVNERPGQDLHAFYWLHIYEIGSLDSCWNVLVGVEKMNPHPGILHYTLGTPNLPGHEDSPCADVWFDARER